MKISLKEDVLNIAIKKLSAMKIEVPQNLIDLANEVEQAILNYCNISKVPNALKYVWANMIVDFVRWQGSVLAENASTDDPSIEASSSSSGNTYVSSIKVGDTTVSFGTDSSSNTSVSLPKNAHSLLNVLDQIIMNYEDSLNKFRKVVW